MDIKPVIWRDFGVANGWGRELPQAVQECKAKGHQLKEKEIGRCHHEVRCYECHIVYNYYSD